jgi:hypothetical protein
MPTNTVCPCGKAVYAAGLCKACYERKRHAAKMPAGYVPHRGRPRKQAGDLARNRQITVCPDAELFDDICEAAGSTKRGRLAAEIIRRLKAYAQMGRIL